MISFEPDDYINERRQGETIWHVILNDGREVFDDDGRGDKASWLRLKEYCDQNGVYPVKMYLKFRSHIEHMPDDADGYFFKKAVRGFWGGRNVHYFLSGVLDGDEVKVQKWRVPELLIETEETRPVEDCEQCLIRR